MNTEILNNLHSISNASVTQQITEMLSKLIINGTVKTGDFLPTEEVLCQEFKVGRSSVREAIKTLETRGMVQKIHGKGIMVVDNSIKAVSDSIRMVLQLKKTTMEHLMEFRNSIEIKMTELAAERATRVEIENIHRALNLMKEEKYSIEYFAALDFDFHQAIAHASGNSVFELMMETIKPIIYNQIIYTLNPNHNPELSLHFHEAIYNAIVEGDPDEAIDAMRIHLSGTSSIIEEINKHKDFNFNDQLI